MSEGYLVELPNGSKIWLRNQSNVWQVITLDVAGHEICNVQSGASEFVKEIKYSVALAYDADLHPTLIRPTL